MTLDQLAQIADARGVLVRVQSANRNHGKETPEQSELTGAHFRIQKIRGVGIGHQSNHALARGDGFDPRRTFFGSSLGEQKNRSQRKRVGCKCQAIFREQ